MAADTLSFPFIEVFKSAKRLVETNRDSVHCGIRVVQVLYYIVAEVGFKWFSHDTDDGESKEGFMCGVSSCVVVSQIAAYAYDLVQVFLSFDQLPKLQVRHSSIEISFACNNKP